MTEDPRVAALIMSLRKHGITDQRVLGAIEKTPRDLFVGQGFEYAAYNDSALPIACGQTISQPYVVAYMTQALDVKDTMRVLELGTGSGYQTAILSPLCRRVYSIERHKPLLREAQQRFNALRLHNVVAKHGDGLAGWADQAPFDRILCTAAMSEVPQSLIEQLKPGGVLIAPLGDVPRGDVLTPTESFSQQLTKIIRSEDGVMRETLIPVLFVPMLPGLPQDKADVGDKKV